MIQFPAYNPIDFSQQFPRSPWETYDDHLNTFYREKGDGRISFMIRRQSGEQFQVRVIRLLDNVQFRTEVDVNAISVVDGTVFVQYSVDISQLQDGKYYFRLFNPTYAEQGFYSEVFCVKSSCGYTPILTLSATNNTNRNGIWIGNGWQFRPYLHLPFEVKDTTETRTNSTMFEMSHGRNLVLDAETFRVREFRFGGKRGVSRYLANVIKAWLYCDDVFVDGYRWRMHSEPEFMTIDNYDNITVRCEMVLDDGFGMMLNPNTQSPEIERPEIASDIIAKWVFTDAADVLPDIGIGIIRLSRNRQPTFNSVQRSLWSNGWNNANPRDFWEMEIEARQNLPAGNPITVEFDVVGSFATSPRNWQMTFNDGSGQQINVGLPYVVSGILGRRVLLFTMPSTVSAGSRFFLRLNVVNNQAIQTGNIVAQGGTSRIANIIVTKIPKTIWFRIDEIWTNEQIWLT